MCKIENFMWSINSLYIRYFDFEKRNSSSINDSWSGWKFRRMCPEWIDTASVKGSFRSSIADSLNNFSAPFVANVFTGGAHHYIIRVPPASSSGPSQVIRRANERTDRQAPTWREQPSRTTVLPSLFLLRSSSPTRDCAEERREASASTSSSALASASCRGRRTIVIGRRASRPSVALSRQASIKPGVVERVDWSNPPGIGQLISRPSIRAI